MMYKCYYNVTLRLSDTCTLEAYTLFAAVMDPEIPDSLLRLFDDVSLNPFILQVLLTGM